MLAHLSARAIDGVEEVRDGTWRRTIGEPDRVGTVEVADDPCGHALRVDVRCPDTTARLPLHARIRRLCATCQRKPSE